MLACFAFSGTGGGVLIRAPGVKWGLGGGVDGSIPTKGTGFGVPSGGVISESSVPIGVISDYKGLKVFHNRFIRRGDPGDLKAASIMRFSLTNSLNVGLCP